MNVSVTLQVVFPREKIPVYTLDRRPSFNKYEYFMPMTGNKSLAVHLVASIILIELVQLSGKFIVFVRVFS
jgi:hypothetical protein